MRAKMIRWACFAAIFSILPFVGSLLVWKGTHPPGAPFYWYYLWERGELLVVSVGFAADAVGECITTKPQFITLRLIVAAVCIFALFLEAIWFALLQSSLATYPPIWITGGSVFLFLLTLGTAGVCKACAALAEEVKT